MLSLKNIYSKAMVTGGAGFVGSHLIDALISDGLEVVCVDDFSAGKHENVEHLKNNPLFTKACCDITNKEELRECFDGVDVVFHNACSKNTVCMTNPQRDLAVNAEGTFNLLELARDNNIKKFIHTSTGSVYGEAQYYPTDEKHPLNPTSYYGVSKLCGDRYARVFSHLYDMDVSILRYYHVYGPRQEYNDFGGVVSIFGRRVIAGMHPIIYGDGSQMRTFTYVKDIANINKLVAAKGVKGEAYNCASGIQVTIKQLADMVLEHFSRTDLEIEFRDWKPGDIKHFDVSNEKIKELGFDFAFPFDQCLKETLEWLTEYFEKKGGGGV